MIFAEKTAQLKLSPAEFAYLKVIAFTSAGTDFQYVYLTLILTTFKYCEMVLIFEVVKIHFLFKKLH